MSRHRRRAPPLPETLDAPDAGFMAAAGAYVAAVLVGASLTVATAVGATLATIVGSVPTAATIGLITGGVISSRITGLPERLGRGWRRLAVPFVVPVAFAGVALAALTFPVLPRPVVAGAGIGAALTFLLAAAVAIMARTRYVRALTPEDPVATVPLLKPTRVLYWIGFGVLWFGLGGASMFVASGLDRIRPALVGLMGLFFLCQGVALRRYLGNPDREDRSDRLLGSTWFADPIDVESLPELRVHGAGLVVKRSTYRRLVPWTTVTGVRLMADELVVERRRGFDVRCARVVIEDAERVQAAIERMRAEGSDGDAHGTIGRN